MITPEARLDAFDPWPMRTVKVRAAAQYAGEWLRHYAGVRGVPGIQAAIRYQGELVLDLAWGVADVENGTPLTQEHLFRVASQSKTVTATAMLQLFEAGILRLDDTLAQWIPELEDSALAGVTLREMLGHQAGIVRDGADADYWQLGREFPDRAALIDICRVEGRVLAPNEQFKYSNIGYGLIGLVIERSSGEAFSDYVRSNIVAPLGLTHTGPEWEIARANEFAAGHTAALTPTDVRRRITHVDTHALAAATGVYSTAAELSSYYDAHRLGSGKLLSDASKRLMRRPESSISVGRVLRHYGLGFELQQHNGIEVIGHGGGYPGHVSRSWLDETSGLVVCVLTNSIDGPADALAEGALSLMHLALDYTHQDDSDAVEVPVGRFASLWSVLDVVRLGGGVYAIPLGSPEPAASGMRLEVVDGQWRTAIAAGFTPTGEPIVVRHGAGGAIESIVVGGITMWPMDDFRHALSTSVPAELLVRMSL